MLDDEEVLREVRERRKFLEKISASASIASGQRVEAITGVTDALRAHAAFADSVMSWTASLGLLGASEWRLPTDALAGVKMLEVSALASF